MRMLRSIWEIKYKNSDNGVTHIDIDEVTGLECIYDSYILSINNGPAAIIPKDAIMSMHKIHPPTIERPDGDKA